MIKTNEQVDEAVSYLMYHWVVAQRFEALEVHPDPTTGTYEARLYMLRESVVARQLRNKSRRIMIITT